MRRSNHLSPDHFLDLENATSVSREDALAAWDRAYAELARRLSAEGKAGTVYIVFGLQGSGKTTWIDTNASRYPQNATFFDGPLPSKRHRQRALAVCKAAGCEAVAVWMNTPFETALVRNASRRGLARIDEEVIAHVRDSLEAPSLDEGFARIMEVCTPEPAPYPSANPDAQRASAVGRR
jgi:predicted kinase